MRKLKLFYYWLTKVLTFISKAKIRVLDVKVYPYKGQKHAGWWLFKSSTRVQKLHDIMSRSSTEGKNSEALTV